MALAYKINIVDDSHSHLSPTIFQNLSIQEVAIPEPGPGSVLVRIHAAALNFRDLLCVADSPLYPVRTVPGLVPCSDGAGEIVKAGSGSKWQDTVGDAVIVVPQGEWLNGDVGVLRIDKVLGAGDNNGTLSQYMVVPDACIVPAPRNLSMEEAAALVSTAGTAINVLESIPIRKNTTVVTQGTGGVSCAVIQYASALGARVIATSSTDEKLQIAKALGASELINYRTTPDWAHEVVRLTDGTGADLVCDVAGWGTLEASVKALKQGGTACVVGMLTPPQPVELLMPLILGAKTLRGILVFSKSMLAKAVRLAEEHDLHPHIEEVFAWEDAPKAFEQLRKQGSVGKVVVRV
ncbi:hypothetical protein LTR10_020076 [Elasticomyces elasticus]|uniref:Enoyl reductase (ER) domain-containing protein n=1 Tax=Exophiala sideris TaxID=1016849 RepID=A0ABR0IVN2_9EURO|nr:hypothetical protein LTR10_020076 [Elasticomyces elasticus]KAK5021342.1 hypothetical protein LTS07_011085 [Exophiala sideris]KAK5024290.1 hypothetical protein LTR13_010911 [Exophiala sideris]KAK5049233.1 hypothetical protein LTR69_011108 [Exophiala sideris]KAK5176545.1 hypothetical protein LTR44_010933 [Eurotiomycetes sp. CCFEE 6388]